MLAGSCTFKVGTYGIGHIQCARSYYTAVKEGHCHDGTRGTQMRYSTVLSRSWSTTSTGKTRASIELWDE